MSFLKNAISGLARNKFVQAAVGTFMPASRPFIAAANASGVLAKRPQAAAPVARPGAGYSSTAQSRAMTLRSRVPAGIGSTAAISLTSGLAMSALPTLARMGGEAVRRYGGTVATVGAAGALLYDAAGNPVRRAKRRSKGITATQLKAFTRVTAILNKYCKTPPPMKKRGSPRSKSCR